MGEFWPAERWVGWLRRGRSDPLPTWQGLTDCANEIGEELARLREVEAKYRTLKERITALQALVASPSASDMRAAAWDMLTEANP